MTDEVADLESLRAFKEQERIDNRRMFALQLAQDAPWSIKIPTHEEVVARAKAYEIFLSRVDVEEVR